MIDSIYQMTDGVADLALSLLLQASLLLAVVLMLVANTRWRRPLRHALCLRAVVLCAGCPVWLWQVRRSQLVWCSIPGPSIGLESAHESEPRSEVAAIDMDRRES